MGQHQEARPAISEEPSPNKSSSREERPQEHFFGGTFQLRENGKTVASTLGGIKKGILLIKGGRLALKQRLSVAGGFLLIAVCLVSILLMTALPERSTTGENVKAILAFTLLGGALLGPIIWTFWVRRFTREYNVADIKDGVVHADELELRIRPAGSPPSAQAVELVFKPGYSSNLTTLTELLMKSGAFITPADEEEIKAIQERILAVTPKVWATFSLMAANVLVFVLTMLGNQGGDSAAGLLKWGADFGPLTANDQQWWRLLASCFLHLGILHLLCNMYALSQVGWLTERLFGNWFFLLIYLGCGLAGNLTSLAFHPAQVSVGASGAIFGVYGALIGYLARQGSGFPRRVMTPVLASAVVFVVWNIGGGLLDMINHYAASIANPQNTRPSIDMAAHGGGLVSGLIFGFLGARPLPGAERRAVTSSRGAALATCICVVTGLLLIPAVKANRLDVVRMKTIAACYYLGKGVAKNPEKASYWLERAATAGDLQAQESLGARYFSGEGVNKDPSRAIPWLEKAAEQGEINAEKMLMGIYFTGQGGPTNALEGVKWLTKIVAQGADQDCNDIEKAVGVAYYQGDGLPKNEPEGIKWLTRVAARGDPGAKAALNTINSQPATRPASQPATSVTPQPGGVWLVRYVVVRSHEMAETIMEGLRKGLSLDDTAAAAGKQISTPRWYKAGELQDAIENALKDQEPGSYVLVETGDKCFVVQLMRKTTP